MAAITPSGSNSQNWGSSNVVVATFTSVSNADTWASGITSTPKWYFGQLTTAQSTQTSAGVNISYSAGTFTFKPAEDAKALTLFVGI